MQESISRDDTRCLIADLARNIALRNPGRVFLGEGLVTMWRKQ